MAVNAFSNDQGVLLSLNGFVGYPDGITAQAVNDALKEHLPDKNKPLTVVISSGGGYVQEGKEIYKLLGSATNQEHTTIIDGGAYSIASVIALSGDDDRLYMLNSSEIMIHSAAYSLAEGTSLNSSDAKELVARIDAINNDLALIYSSKSNKLSHEEFNNLLSESGDHYYNAARATQELGIKIDPLTPKQMLKMQSMNNKVIAADFSNQVATQVVTKLNECPSEWYLFKNESERLTKMQITENLQEDKQEAKQEAEAKEQSADFEAVEVSASNEAHEVVAQEEANQELKAENKTNFVPAAQLVPKLEEAARPYKKYLNSALVEKSIKFALQNGLTAEDLEQELRNQLNEQLPQYNTDQDLSLNNSTQKTKLMENKTLSKSEALNFVAEAFSKAAQTGINKGDYSGFYNLKRKEIKENLALAAGGKYENGRFTNLNTDDFKKVIHTTLTVLAGDLSEGQQNNFSDVTDLALPIPVENFSGTVEVLTPPMDVDPAKELTEDGEFENESVRFKTTRASLKEAGKSLRRTYEQLKSDFLSLTTITLDKLVQGLYLWKHEEALRTISEYAKTLPEGLNNTTLHIEKNGNPVTAYTVLETLKANFRNQRTDTGRSRNLTAAAVIVDNRHREKFEEAFNSQYRANVYGYPTFGNRAYQCANKIIFADLEDPNSVYMIPQGALLSIYHASTPEVEVKTEEVQAGRQEVWYFVINGGFALVPDCGLCVVKWDGGELADFSFYEETHGQATQQAAAK